jgi:hypothetical protein
MRLEFNDHEQLSLIDSDGRSHPITCPYTPDGRVYADSRPSGVFALLGAGLCPNPSRDPGAARAWIDFVRLDELTTLRRWSCDAHGRYLHQTGHAVVRTPSAHGYLLNPGFLSLAHRQLNDFQIYTFLRHCLGRPTAQAYIDSCAADHTPPSGQRHCRLVILFNHNYVRTCRVWHDYYQSRFPVVDFVLPCVAPDHPNYFAYPFGSLQFHGLIYSYLQEQARTGRVHDCDAFLFIQDDLLLHPRLSSSAILSPLTAGHSGIFHVRRPCTLDDDPWMWIARVRNAIQRQSDPLYGNGFEGLYPAVPITALHRGVSDCFALAGELVPDFVANLAPLVAANVFAEVAIPTALFATADHAGRSILLRPGRLLRAHLRGLAGNPAYIRHFVDSDAMFLHPVKVAAGAGETLRLVREAAAAAAPHRDTQPGSRRR